MHPILLPKHSARKTQVKAAAGRGENENELDWAGLEADGRTREPLSQGARVGQARAKGLDQARRILGFQERK